MIIAKTVVPNQYWILRQDDQKIGNIEVSPGGYQVKINDKIHQYTTINTLKKDIGIEFETVVKKPIVVTSNEVNGYPTTSTPHNAIYDLKHQVPLWTKEPRSKSWFAAGWYSVKQGRVWEAIECPKLIMLERYKYRGPFYTKEQSLTNI